MNRKSIFIEVEELRSRLDDSNIRLYDATIIFFEIATDPTTAYEKYLQGHIPGAAFFDHDFFSDLDNLTMSHGCISQTVSTNVRITLPRGEQRNPVGH